MYAATAYAVSKLSPVINEASMQFHETSFPVDTRTGLRTTLITTSRHCVTFTNFASTEFYFSHTELKLVNTVSQT